MRGQHSWRAGIRISAMVVAILAVAGPATPQIWTGASSADDLQYRLSVIDAELADIRARIGNAPSAGGGGVASAGSFLKTPIPGLYWASMSHVYPWDRGTNYAVEIGHKVAQEAGQTN